MDKRFEIGLYSLRGVPCRRIFLEKRLRLFEEHGNMPIDKGRVIILDIVGGLRSRFKVKRLRLGQGRIVCFSRCGFAWWRFASKGDRQRLGSSWRYFDLI